jgi:DNA invertase Pin-like site-specific DNA recombinase
MIYAYLRVSTREQNLERQIIAVKDYRPELLEENIFCDKESGKNFKRKEYERLKGLLCPGDELIIKELDRLGRNKAMIKEELAWFKQNGVTVRILNVPTTLIDYQGQEWLFDMVNNILIEVMGAVAQEELEKRELRQKEGIAAMPVVNGRKVSAKTGRAMGREKVDIPDFGIFREKVSCGELSVVESCKQLGISRTQWYRLCKVTPSH